MYKSFLAFAKRFTVRNLTFCLALGLATFGALDVAKACFSPAAAPDKGLCKADLAKDGLLGVDAL